MEFSFRIKVLLAATACILLVIFLAFAVGNFYINELQRANVEQAVNLAEEQARLLRQNIREILLNQPGTDLRSPGVQKDIEQLTRVMLRVNNNIAWVGVFDGEGQLVRADEGAGGTSSPRGTTGEYAADIRTPTGEDVTVQVERGVREISEPILLEGGRIGEVRMRMTDSAAYQRIEKTSRRITATLLFEIAGILVLLIVFFFFVYRMFQRQLQLQHANSQLDRMAYVGTLASGLAHEIRNPLGAMSVNLEVISEELDDPRADSIGRVRDLASRVQREVGQLNATLGSFLDFALPSKEGLTDFSLRGLLEELLAAHAEQMNQKAIQYDLTAPARQECVIEGDRRALYQALRNILINAIQVMDGSLKKQVRISVQALSGARFRITVADSGPGIPPENLEKVFEIFFSQRAGGSGFGLAIARNVIEEHGGTIRAGNNEDSLGATFVIELPRRPKPRIR